MDDLPVGSQPFLAARGITAWANVPRERVMRNMERDKCLEMRFQSALVLWSWCGPQPCEQVVKKNNYGRIERNGAGLPVIAKLRDIAELLGVHKATISKMVKLLVSRNELRYEDRRTLVLVFKPLLVDKTAKAPSADRSWNIANTVVKSDILPPEPTARAELTMFLDNCSTGWKHQLNDVRTNYRKLLIQGLSERGISIEKKRKTLRIRQTDELSAVADVRSSVHALPAVDSSREKIRILLTQRYGKILQTPLKGKPLDQLADLIDNDSVFERFERQLDTQKPFPRSWMLFVQIAISCNEGHAADDKVRKASETKAGIRAEEWRESQKRERETEERIEGEVIRIEKNDEASFEDRVRGKVEECKRQHPRMTPLQLLDLARRQVRNEIREEIVHASLT